MFSPAKIVIVRGITIPLRGNLSPKMGIMTKSDLRREMRHRNRALSETERQAAAARIADAVEQLPEFAAARTVALFCSLPDEPPTEGMLARWEAAGKRLAVPRVEGETMRFHPYFKGSLAPGAFGIAEPAEGEALDPAEIDLMLVPGVAFTAGGARLGRGRGYYDRYLSQPGFRAATVGTGFAHQLAESLPVEPHDVRLDRVICR